MQSCLDSEKFIYSVGRGGGRREHYSFIEDDTEYGLK